ncbi:MULTISPECIES: HlyD family secretion protein [unclassified Paludibacterium]|uniref:HlyD family secretion protein n=1 Tax=unclassified Paludibacterium TaxID=2618429 RepID=UPI001C03A4D3|nr:HlyD family secretion protein [Paludibacterium sp. B53371]BEV71735.1 multidrug efflux MFS transporter adaptor subunit VceA [Paludibacterium sp. THUN1379]
MNLANPNQRRRLFILLAGACVAAAAGFGAYWLLYASNFVSTDNAYTAAEVALVTPAVGGTVARVNVVDTQKVRRGDVLVVIDNTDATLALQQAEAEYGRAVRKVRGMVATDAGLEAQIDAQLAAQTRATAQLQAAQADFERASIDLKRRQALAGTGSVSGEELTQAQNAFASAQANLSAARAATLQAHANRAAAVGQRDANHVLIDNSSVEANPEVALARAKRDQARVDLERTIVRAPVDGVVARRQVQIGQRVQAGSVLLSVVPLAQMHVDANFKEVQLTDVRPGQKAEVTADLYGSSVRYHGVVAGFAGGTGSAFAMIPAQNATGNWIKVVQRLPIRIQLDPAELARHPLQVGLSMQVRIDTRDGK